MDVGFQNKCEQLEEVSLPSVDAILDAQKRLAAGRLVRTPLVKLNTNLVDVSSASCCSLEIYLKLENEQVCGAFKTRGAYNYLSQRSDAELQNGVVTASTGSFAQVKRVRCFCWWWWLCRARIIGNRKHR